MKRVKTTKAMEREERHKETMQRRDDLDVTK